LSKEEKVAAEVSAPKKKRKTSRRLTPAEWGECGAFWESGQFTLTMLSERYNVTPESISRKMTKMGYTKGSQAELNEEETKKSIASAFTIARDEIAKRLLDTRNRTYKYVSIAEQMAMIELDQANKNKEPIGLRRDNLRAINEAMSIFEKAQRQKLISLGIKDGEFDIGEELPTLSISEMTNQEVEDAINQAEDLDFGPAEEEPSEGDDFMDRTDEAE